MNTYIALLRGINIGGKHILPMKELVRLLEGLGCKDVKTYIQSGNVVFHATENNRQKLAKVIGRKIVDAYGFEPKVILLDKTMLLDAISRSPFKTDIGKSLHLFFLDSKPQSPDLARLNTLKSTSEQFKLDNGVFYLFTPDGLAGSRMPANIEKCLGVTATARNWNTVCKLKAMVSEL